MNEVYDKKLHYAWLFLKIAYGCIVLIAGIDKFFYILNPYNEGIIHQFIRALIPLKTLHLLYLIGIFEIINGIMILTNFTYWGALILMAWYLIIDVNLFLIGPMFYMLILNNLGHATANFALAQLTRFLNKR